MAWCCRMYSWVSLKSWRCGHIEEAEKNIFYCWCIVFCNPWTIMLGLTLDKGSNIWNAYPRPCVNRLPHFFRFPFYPALEKERSLIFDYGKNNRCPLEWSNAFCSCSVTWQCMNTFNLAGWFHWAWDDLLSWCPSTQSNFGVRVGVWDQCQRMCDSKSALARYALDVDWFRNIL